MRMVTADGRGYASKKPEPAKPEPQAGGASSLRLTLSYVFLLAGGVVGLHRLYNGQPIFAFVQALASAYILLEFGTMASLYVGIILLAWLIADAFAIPKWVAGRNQG
jgi:TM2 domain-containing membrane protein YozV